MNKSVFGAIIKSNNYHRAYYCDFNKSQFTIYGFYHLVQIRERAVAIMWMYTKNGKIFGPVSLEEIVNQINAGVINSKTAVYRSGEKIYWAGEHPELKEYFTKTPPADQTSQSNASSSPAPDPAPAPASARKDEMKSSLLRFQDLFNKTFPTTQTSQPKPASAPTPTSASSSAPASASTLTSASSSAPESEASPTSASSSTPEAASSSAPESEASPTSEPDSDPLSISDLKSEMIASLNKEVADAFAMKDYAKAISDLESILELEPDQADVQTMLDVCKKKLESEDKPAKSEDKPASTIPGTWDSSSAEKSSTSGFEW